MKHTVLVDYELAVAQQGFIVRVWYFRDGFGRAGWPRRRRRSARVERCLEFRNYDITMP